MGRNIQELLSFGSPLILIGRRLWTILQVNKFPTKKEKFKCIVMKSICQLSVEYFSKQIEKKSKSENPSLLKKNELSANVLWSSIFVFLKLGWKRTSFAMWRDCQRWWAEEMSHQYTNILNISDHYGPKANIQKP